MGTGKIMKTQEVLPTFNIDLSTFIQDLTDLITIYKATIDDIANSSNDLTWEGMSGLTVIGDQYNKLISPVGHLTNVKDSDELRDVWDQALPIMSEFGTWAGQHESFAMKIKGLKDSGALSEVQQKIIDDEWLGFELSGIGLPEDKKKRVGEINKNLSELSNNFGKNILDATKAWTYQTRYKDELDGIPETSLAIYEQAAKARDVGGYIITLDHPSITPLLTYCTNRELREKIYRAHVTKASHYSEHKEFNNTQTISDIMDLRFESSKIFDRGTPADISLLRKMADSPKQVVDFMYDACDKAKAKAEADEQILCDYAKAKGCKNLEPWDRAFYSEMLKKERYDVDDEEVKKYFQLDTVLSGMFGLIENMYGIKIVEEPNNDVWVDDVRFFRLYENGEHFASLYMDLISDPDRKRGGAWMDQPIIRWDNNGTIQLPVAYNVCNFPPATSDAPSLLSHRDVETIFHEFGHALHHMLTTSDIYDVSGINGVEWDAVELPSQIMENWCWDEEVLTKISKHYKTGESIPKELFDKMTAAKNYMSGHALLRQMEMSLFDMLLHINYEPWDVDGTIRGILQNIRDRVSVVETPHYNRFENSFSHIFDGGYDAGYFSYIWAEILSSDAFSKFKEEGIFNPDVANKFREEILSQGGTKSMKILFKNFMGRDPQPEAMLRDRGIIQ